MKFEVTIKGTINYGGTRGTKQDVDDHINLESKIEEMILDGTLDLEDFNIDGFDVTATMLSDK